MTEDNVAAVLSATNGITLSWQSIITAGAVLGALTALGVAILKLVRWIDRQQTQDKELEALRARHDQDNQAIQRELAILTYGVLACLKGLKEQGCNGPVTEAVNKIDKYINLKAHDKEDGK